jgi:ribosomal protein S2
MDSTKQDRVGMFCGCCKQAAIKAKWQTGLLTNTNQEHTKKVPRLRMCGTVFQEADQAEEKSTTTTVMTRILKTRSHV